MAVEERRRGVRPRRAVDVSAWPRPRYMRRRDRWSRRRIAVSVIDRAAAHGKFGMPEESAVTDAVLGAAEALLRAYQSLGAEHQALAAEEKKEAQKERLGTLRRMKLNTQEASQVMVNGLNLLAMAHGMQALGLQGQASQDVHGNYYSPLPCVTDPHDHLYQASLCVARGAELLVKAYSPTKKYPSLAVARCPEAMSQVFAALRDTLAALCACMDDDEEEEAITGMGALTTRLEHLEKRTCSPVPAQRSKITADDVACSILADPEIAVAAREALARMNP